MPAQALCGWQEVVERHHQLQVKGRMVAAQWLNRSLGAAFRAWVGFTAYRAQLRCKAAVLASVLNSLQRKAFNSWVAYVLRKRAIAEKVGRDRVAVLIVC